MPLLGFKKQFAGLVASGQKRQTIRAFRKDKRDPRPGDRLYLYEGLRTKSCRKIGEYVCKSVKSIEIIGDPFGKGLGEVRLNMERLSEARVKSLAKADGFESVNDFFIFFGLKFAGVLIKW